MTLKLNDIIKDVNLKAKGSHPNMTYCNVLLFFIHCIENNIGDEAYLKYKVARFYKYVQDNKCANNSFYGWSKTIPFLRENEDMFNEFCKTINKKDLNYIDIQKYVKEK